MLSDMLALSVSLMREVLGLWRQWVHFCSNCVNSLWSEGLTNDMCECQRI